MLDIYTVSFFGHRRIESGADIETKLDALLHDIITQKEYVEFLIGRDGEFDLLAAAAIRRAINRYGCGNTHFSLILPYMRAEYRQNKREFLDYYDEVEICGKSAHSHPKAAIQIRNRIMVDRSDLVVCYVQRRSGGAYQTIKYAKKCKKEMICLADKAHDNMGHKA